jgi:transducin (beta)-like 1
MTITSDELNFLVFRYLKESGFVHSAFVFSYESMVSRTSAATADVPPGALINFMHKGLQFSQLEQEIEAGTLTAPDAEPVLPSLIHRRKKHKKRNKANGNAAGRPSSADDAMEIEAEEALTIPGDQVTVLPGHTAEVFTVAWDPHGDRLASGSGDSTARIWRIPAGPCGEVSGRQADAAVLQHDNTSPVKDVTVLDWHPDGSMLATGSYDGIARIWSAETGELKHTLKQHTGTVLALRWNRSGTRLLSGGIDHSALVWDAKTGTLEQSFKYHTGPTLDVAWKDDDAFASSSGDARIHLCRVGEKKPYGTLEGHRDEINVVRWDAQGKVLASGSDDYTVKLWTPDTNANSCAFDLTEHSNSVYTLRWCPDGSIATGGGGEGGESATSSLLASGSFDCSVKLWDTNVGTCLLTFLGHRDPVYTIEFSPDGKYLASASHDKTVKVWDVKSGTLVRQLKAKTGVYEVSWNATGDKIAAALTSPENAVCVFDFRM